MRPKHQLFRTLKLRYICGGGPWPHADGHGSPFCSSLSGCSLWLGRIQSVQLCKTGAVLSCGLPMTIMIQMRWEVCMGSCM